MPDAAHPEVEYGNSSVKTKSSTPNKSPMKEIREFNLDFDDKKIKLIDMIDETWR